MVAPAPDEVDEQELLEELAGERDSRWPVFEEVLGEMTPIYHDESRWLDIVRSSISHAKPGGTEIGIQPDLPMEMEPEVTGPDILRLLDDLCAHEVEHVNASDLDAKGEFMRQYPNFGKMAGHVYNIFEDEYIDMRRKRRFFGMRTKLAYYVWLHMNTESRAPPVDVVEEREGIANALMSGLLQVALAGYMNGDPSDEVYDAMARMEPLLEMVRTEDDVNRREVICHGAMQILLRYIPDPEEYDGDKMDERKRAAGGDPREHDDESPSDGGDPRVEMDDDMESAVKEMLEEMIDDEEIPDPVPDGDPEPITEFEDDEDEEPEDEGCESGGGEDSESMDADDAIDSMDEEMSDPLGAESESGGESADDGEGVPGGGSAGESDEPDRDIEAILEKYGAESLTVTN